MPAVARKLAMTAEEYLALESASAERHEFVDGEIFAMTGASDWHNDIVFRLTAALRAHFEPHGCRVHTESVKLAIESANSYLYPDVFVTCDPRDHGDRLIKRHASVAVEVLSESTAQWDRDGKFARYRKLASLQAYVMVDTQFRHVEVYERQATPFWRYASFGAGETARLDVVGVAMVVDELYVDTQVPAEAVVVRAADRT